MAGQNAGWEPGEQSAHTEPRCSLDLWLSPFRGLEGQLQELRRNRLLIDVLLLRVVDAHEGFDRFDLAKGSGIGGFGI